MNNFLISVIKKLYNLKVLIIYFTFYLYLMLNKNKYISYKFITHFLKLFNIWVYLEKIINIIMFNNYISIDDFCFFFLIYSSTNSKVGFNWLELMIHKFL